MPEQGRTGHGDGECTFCVLQQRHHVADGLLDFVGVREGRRSWPAARRTLGPSLLDERPKVHQGRMHRGFVGSQHGAMTKQACKVEIPRCNTIHPIANSLARDTGELGHVSECGSVGYRGECVEDVRHTVDLAGQSIARENPLMSAAVRILTLGQDDFDTAIIVSRCLETTTDPRVGELQIFAATLAAETARKNVCTASRDVLGIPGRLC